MNNRVFSLKIRMFLLIFALLAAQGALIGVAITKSSAVLTSMNNISEKSLPATKHILTVQTYHQKIRSLVLQTLNWDNQLNLERPQKAKKEIKKQADSLIASFKKLKSLPGFTAEMKRNFGEAEETLYQYNDNSMLLVDAVFSGKRDDFETAKMNFEASYDKAEASLKSVEKYIDQDAKSADGEGEDIIKSVVIFSLVGLFISAVVGFLIFIWTKKSFDLLLNKVAGVSDKVSNLSVVLGDESNKVKDSTVEQSAAIQESVSALSEMSSMIAQTGQNIKLSLETSQGALEKSTEGKQIMDRMSHSMTSIQKANDQLQEISKVIEDISSKTAIINDIVFKTQLLSFNASIEAARAGQHGRGFAVVAEEVGNLAELSGQAAKDIELLLGDSQRKVKETLEMIQSRVNDGNKVSQRAMEAFNEISQNIEEINAQVRSINEATQQQEIGIQQTNLAMKQMDVISQDNTVASSEALQVAQNLKGQSAELRHVMNALFELVGGGRSHHTPVDQEQSPFNKPVNPEGATFDHHMEELVHQIASKKMPSVAPMTNDITADDPDFKRAV